MIRKMELVLSFCAIFLQAHPQETNLSFRLKITADGHYLQHQKGKPFFWLGDTGWELFHRLTREEIKRYINNRAAKGFNVIQAVALAEFDGLRKANRYGELPLINLDPLHPNSAYFSLIDSSILWARQKNMFIALLPTWGDKVARIWGQGPEVFDSNNAYGYGKWIGNRYKDADNIIWVLGGDRPAVDLKNDWRPIWRAMARGIIEATHHQCLITYHPSGGSNSTSQWLQKEPWLDINMFQSGHGGGHDVACWELVKRDRSMFPIKPTLDAEPNYEDHPVNPWPKWNPENGYFRDYDVRKQIYRSVFAGACGVTYGHHAIWQFMSEREETVNYPDRGWVNAMDRPGAFQAGYLLKLIDSFGAYIRIPDSTLLAAGQGINGEHIEAFHSSGNDLAMIYLPVGKSIAIKTDLLIGNTLKGWWFNPRSGSYFSMGTLQKNKLMQFTAPESGIEKDFVLILDSRH